MNWHPTVTELVVRDAHMRAQREAAVNRLARLARTQPSPSPAVSATVPGVRFVLARRLVAAFGSLLVLAGLRLQALDEPAPFRIVAGTG